MTPLSPRDLAALAQAQRVALSPLTYSSPEAWLRALTAELQTLFEADRAVVTLAGGGGATLVAEGVDALALAEYDADFAAADRAGEIVTSLPVPYYVQEDVAADDRFRAHIQGAVYNEWYRPHGLTRALGLFVVGPLSEAPDLYARQGVGIVANVLVAGTAMSAGPGADRARTMLAFLQPALAASVGVVQRAGHAAARLGAVVDGLGAVAWLYDAEGRVLHESPAAGQGLDPGGAALRGAAARLARRVVQAQRAGRAASSSQSVEIAGAAARLVATCLAPDGFGDPAVLVVVEASPLPSADAIRERFGLTPQQARVARMLAERRSTSEIAAALYISGHTVRRHTEQVLGRLGVTRRGDVERIVRGG